MKYLKQFGIIIAISFLGEILKAIIPLSIPANIYGLVLMLLALVTKTVKLSEVKETAYFLVEIMTVMFIPAGVGLMASWGLLKDILIPVIVITPVTTVIVMAVTGRITQMVVRLEKKRSKR
ncbi:MAG: CidA/LrgA family protein [Lachnospiraceae bacterium]